MRTTAKALILLIFLASFLGSANARHNYYPQSLQEKIENNQIKGEELKEKLFRTLHYPHLRQENGPDILGCDLAEDENCYRQKDLGYRRAREVLFGSLHLEQKEDGRYFLIDMYCNIKITEDETSVGPYQIPSHMIVNTEHTWPQSRFTNRFPIRLQRSDLHHLFPVDPMANNVRANFEMADVIGDPIREEDCYDSTFGEDILSGSQQRFEPPAEYKGMIARALLYFSLRYRAPISDEEEIHLRQWHNDWPVTDFERQRNEAIYQYQKNRNPFIDYPELVNLIDEF